MKMKHQDTLIPIGIFLYGLMLFTIGLNHQEIIGFESRFYLFVLEMWRHGPSWFATTYHEPYPDYPGTAIFIIYVFSKFAGELNKFTAIFPSAFVSALTLSVTYLIGALQSRRLGLGAVCFLLLTNAFVREARTISLDQYTTLITAACFYLTLKYSEIKVSRWIFLFLAMGFAIRGPMGLVIPTGVLCTFYLLEKDYKRFFYVGLMATLVLIVCGAMLLGLAYHVGGGEFVQDVLDMQVLGRMNDAKPLPWYFYWVESLGAYAISYPLAILVLCGFTQIRAVEQKFLLKLTGWVLVIFLGLSFPTDKKIRYVLPCAPAFALICAYMMTGNFKSKYLNLLRQAVYYFCAAFPSLCLILLIILKITHDEFNFVSSGLMIFFVLMQIMVLLARNDNRRELWTLFVASFVFAMTYVYVVEPINLQLNQTREFVRQIEGKRMDEGAQLVFYQERPDALAIKYLVNMPNEEEPTFIYQSDDLLKFKQPTFFIASEENFQRIPDGVRGAQKIILRGKLGHALYVVFVNIPVSPPAAGS